MFNVICYCDKSLRNVDTLRAVSVGKNELFQTFPGFMVQSIFFWKTLSSLIGGP